MPRTGIERGERERQRERERERERSEESRTHRELIPSQSSRGSTELQSTRETVCLRMSSLGQVGHEEALDQV